MNRIESPEITHVSYGQLIFDKGGRRIKWSKNSLFNKWCWENWTGICKKINSRWVKDLNISHDPIKVLEENTGRKISDIPCRSIFTDTSPRTRDIKKIKNKCDFIKIKSFCMAQQNSIKMEREQTVCENIFANGTSDKGLISKIYKELA